MFADQLKTRQATTALRKQLARDRISQLALTVRTEATKRPSLKARPKGYNFGSAWDWTKPVRG